MSPEWFRAIAPFITLFIAVGLGVLGWAIRYMFADLKKNISEKFAEQHRRIKKLEGDVDTLSEKRGEDIKYLLERFTPSDQFMAEVGANRRVVDEIFSRINELNATVNQLIGQWKVMKGIYDEHLRTAGQHKGPHSTGS